MTTYIFIVDNKTNQTIGIYRSEYDKQETIEQAKYLQDKAYSMIYKDSNALSEKEINLIDINQDFTEEI